MWAVAILIVGVLGLGGVFLLSRVVGHGLTAPSPSVVGAPPSDLPVEMVSLNSQSGNRLSGWFLRGRHGYGAIVLMHGVRDDRLQHLGRARFLWEAGYSVFLFDFSAHGESQGSCITTGYLESLDATAAFFWLKQTCPGEKIGCIGISLGGAAALLADPPLHFDALVLEMVYATIDDAIDNRLRIRLGPLSPWVRFLLTSQVEPRTGRPLSYFRPVERIGLQHCPILLICGDQDKRTLISEQHRMMTAAEAPISLWEVPGAAHENIYDLVPEEYRHRVGTFFEQALGHSS
jgi:fermentation-respiration switch protein FrsA (DUF1100 family)